MALLKNRNIITIGASEGGLGSLQKLVADFPEDLPAAVFIVLHIPPDEKNYLASILGKSSKIPVVQAKDGDPIRLGQIYVPVPDHHLMIEDSKVRLDHGPKINFHRPAVDALFRSAAQEHESQVIGVVLTGALDCGTLGLLEIKRHGGLAVVQDPHDAFNPSMPASALRHVPVDHCLPLSILGSFLSNLVKQPLNLNSGSSTKPQLIPTSSESALSPHICPECGGPLWCQETGRLLHYHCRTGHKFSGDSLLVQKTGEIEKSLWSSINFLEDKAEIARQMGERAGGGEFEEKAEYYFNQASKARSCAKNLVNYLLEKDTPAATTETQSALDSSTRESKEKKNSEVA